MLRTQQWLRKAQTLSHVAHTLEFSWAGLSQQQSGVVRAVIGKLRPTNLSSDEGHFKICGSPGLAWEIRESVPEEGTSELRHEWQVKVRQVNKKTNVPRRRNVFCPERKKLKKPQGDACGGTRGRGSMGKAEAGHGPALGLEGLEWQVWTEDFILVAWDSLAHRDSKPVTPFLFTSQDRKRVQCPLNQARD